MGLAKCPNGHIYNPRRYGKICPYCNMKTQDEAFAEKPLGFEPPVEILEETVRPVCGWIICIEGAKVLRVFETYLPRGSPVHVPRGSPGAGRQELHNALNINPLHLLSFL